MVTVLICHSLRERRPIIRELLARNAAWTIVQSDSPDETFRVLSEQDVGVVLTSINVEDVNGQPFLEALRAQCPQIPTIVITPGGPNKALVRALFLGAASYVPDSAMARDLGSTVERLLALADPQPAWIQIQPHWRDSETRFVLPNDQRLVPDVISHLQDELSRYGICGPEHRTRVGMALSEALANAIVHGNLEISSSLRETDFNRYEQELSARPLMPPYNARLVRLRARFSTTGAEFTISDQGFGFDVTSVPDPTLEENLLKLTGRGLLLMRAFADKLAFNDVGNEVTMSVLLKPHKRGAASGPG